MFSGSSKTCVKDKSHVYPSGYSKCPWCEIKHPLVPQNNDNANKQQTGTNTSYGMSTATGNMGTSIRRESWPLWLTCILAGLISGPFMAQFLVPICYDSLDFALSYEAAYIILAIIGGISGAIIAHYGQESYQKAYNAWPWLLLGLLVPFGTALIVAAVMLVIFLVVFVVTVALYIIGTIIAIACVCGMCSGG